MVNVSYQEQRKCHKLSDYYDDDEEIESLEEE